MRLLNKKAQALVEYILFIMFMIIACVGVFRLFVLAWQYKFNIISTLLGYFNVFV